MSTSNSPLIAVSSLATTSPNTRKRRLSDASQSQSEDLEVGRAKKSRSAQPTDDLHSGAARSNNSTSIKEELKDGHIGGREKKRRRKKKRKVSIVPHSAVADNPASSRAEPVASGSGSRPSPSLTIRGASPASAPATMGATAASARVSPDNAISTAVPTCRSATLSDTEPSYPSVTSPIEKGKGKATPSPPRSSRATPVPPVISSDPPATPTAESIGTSAGSSLGSHNKLLETVLPSLTCQICLLLMHRPFALAPCGHMACHSCLVNWFAPNAAAPEQAPADNAVPENAPGPPAAPAPVQPQPRVLAIYRKKTCPHCRAVVCERPVEVWNIKDMVGAVVRSGLVDQDLVPAELKEGTSGIATAGNESNSANNTSDPWKDIFVAPLSTASRRLPAPHIPPHIREMVGILDTEDGGIYRCVDCAHEIVNGVCTDCGRVYPGRIHDANWLLDESDSELDAEEAMALLPWHHGLAFNAALADLITAHGSDADFDDGWSDEDQGVDEEEVSEEEDYEGSFIDDDNDEGIHEIESDPLADIRSSSREPRPRRLSSRPTAEAGEGSSRSNSRGDPVAPIIISSDEEGSEAANDIRRPQRRGPAASLPGSRRRRSYVLSDEEEERLSDGEDNLAAEVASREREHYGDDGSLPPRHSRIPLLDEEDDSDRDGSDGGESDHFGYDVSYDDEVGDELEDIDADWY